LYAQGYYENGDTMQPVNVQDGWTTASGSVSLVLGTAGPRRPGKITYYYDLYAQSSGDGAHGGASLTIGGISVAVSSPLCCNEDRQNVEQLIPIPFELGTDFIFELAASSRASSFLVYEHYEWPDGSADSSAFAQFELYEEDGVTPVHLVVGGIAPTPSDPIHAPEPRSLSMAACGMLLLAARLRRAPSRSMRCPRPAQ
jgi:hypothetical protein